MHNTKSFEAKIKAVGSDSGLDEGQIRAIVSVFGNTDSYGDVVAQGAFKEDLDRWEDSGDKIPFVWAHNWEDPFSHVGEILEAKETEFGLEVLAQIHDLDTNPTAAQVYRLLKGRRITQFSFAYDVEDSAVVKVDGEDVVELRKLRIFEAGPCLVGVNQDTQLLDVKARAALASVKAGRVLSQKNFDHLVAARDALDEVIKAAAPEEEGEKAETVEESSQAETDETQAGKSVGAPRRALAIATITTMEGMGR